MSSPTSEPAERTPALVPAQFGQVVLGYPCLAVIAALAVTFSNRIMAGIRIIGELIASGAGDLAGDQVASRWKASTCLTVPLRRTPLTHCTEGHLSS